MLISIHPTNPQPRQLAIIKDCLESGGIIAYPTDTIYGLGCDIFHPEAVEKICAIKKVSPEKAQLSFICSDLSHLSNYAKSINNSLFRILKSTLPGPFTFILNASNEVPKYFDSNKKEIGIRIPNNEITLEIVRLLGNPLATSSLHNDEDEIQEYFSNPTVIYERFSDKIDFIIDGGVGKLEPSTIIDCSSGVAQVIRQGLGIFEN
jgi:tRNA threonylcarbamoyl adenosine modification protein (Sua5/YciO/YrdC/YwlC family)